MSKTTEESIQKITEQGWVYNTKTLDIGDIDQIYSRVFRSLEGLKVFIFIASQESIDDFLNRLGPTSATGSFDGVITHQSFVRGDASYVFSPDTGIGPNRIVLCPMSLEYGEYKNMVLINLENEE